MSFLMFSNTGSRYARVFPDPVSAAIMYYKHRGEKDGRVERKDGGFITNLKIKGKKTLESIRTDRCMQ